MTVTTTDAVIAEGGRATGAAPSVSARPKRNWAWLGLLPFLLFLVLFLFVPAASVFVNALRTESGWSLSAMKEGITGQNWEAFMFSISSTYEATIRSTILSSDNSIIIETYSSTFSKTIRAT